MTVEHINIGILFESNEWSDHKLASELELALAANGINGSVALIDMQEPDAIKAALDCDLLISRVFASAVFRKHEQSHINMEKLMDLNAEASIPMLNSERAHHFEVDKQASTNELAKAGLEVPRIQACSMPDGINTTELEYPCIIKPNCGGRTTYTSILRDQQDTNTFLDRAPSMVFIVEDFIDTENRYLTRVEIVDSEVALIVKRSIAENGLSGYREGSTYSIYRDPSPDLIEDAKLAAQTLDFVFGSFDIIESEGKRYFIDANSVSNVSEDCTEFFNCDLMAKHATGIVGWIIRHESEFASN